RTGQDTRRHAERREQQVRIRRITRDRQAAHDAPVVRRIAATVGVQTRLASRAVTNGPGHGVRRRRGRRSLPLHRRRSELEGAFGATRQKHWDVLRSDDAGDSWKEVSGNLPSDFGFVIDVNANEPETIYVVPIKSDSEHFPPDGKLRVYRSRSGGSEWEALTSGLPQRDCYVNVLRDAMAVDALDKCG